ncbi:hypothetical protein EW146_g8944 [Bondarzewia mesenterica]|uniref:DUF4139 domain-containing protein n=1 Tax=Bondarzewia mesenterica TaxID=1095465 RepID=A0A4S4LAN3_9AGAM|nr:hypothetical protein EW146_g8944 [Bondarzewia mesenterica]
MSSLIQVDASEHRLSSVTVFQTNKAEVVRNFKLKFQIGENKVEILNLPTCIDTESARVTGLGAVQLFDVVCTTGDSSPTGPAHSFAEIIRTLESKKTALVAERQSLKAAAAVLESYAKTLSSNEVSPEQADAFLERYVARSRGLITEGAHLDEKILDLGRKIEEKTMAGSQKKGKTGGKVTVVVMARHASEVKLKLTYIVREATWSPTYELHASTQTDPGKPASSMSLHYRARITQSTGEDWANVGLTLSTAAMDWWDQSIPELKPVRIRPPMTFVKHRGTSAAPPAPPTPPAFRARTADQRQAPPAPALATYGAREDDGEEDGWAALVSETEMPPAHAVSFSEPKTVVMESPLSVSYRVEGESSIPSDGEVHKVSVAELQFEAQVMHVAVPRVKAVAYLQAEVKNTSEYRLLPGIVNVFMDDGYVSKAFIKDITPGDTFECTLGPDSSTRITHTRQSKLVEAKASAFVEQFNTTTYTSRMTIHNRHAFALDNFILRDALPISDDEDRVKVILRRPAALAEMSDDGKECNVKIEGGEAKVRWRKCEDGKSGKKDGFFEWVCRVEAGKEVVVETEWEVKAPVDLRWVET